MYRVRHKKEVSILKYSKREKVHPPYYAIKAYQILNKKTDEQMAEILHISKRTYTDKVNGYSDFTNMQGNVLAEVFHKTKDEIFLT